MHRRLTDRNKGLFSAYSFAYRPDKNVFEAIIHLQRMLQPAKTFILKYDYSKYFDTIEHNYLRKLIARQSFVVTTAERTVIDAFLKHEYATYPSWQSLRYQKRTLGVPQGSSLSLFLSNIAAHDLDMTLERANGSFVRFADDVIAVAHSFTAARNIELEFREHCERSGVKINYEKSSGITLLKGRLSDDGRSFFLDADDGGDINHKEHIDFLGHRVCASRIDLTERAIKRIKKKISRIIYLHLLLYPRRKHPINPTRLGLGHVDWDLVTCLNEIRRYIYGGLKEKALTSFIDNDVKLPFVRGLMAFYPLISKVDSLAELDGWLVNVVQRALRARSKIIIAQGLDFYVIDEKNLIEGDWYSSDVPNETAMPSFVRGWRAARKFYKRYGLSEVKAPGYYSLLSLY
jgi:RNA-directed DNA polymerase